MACAPTAAAVLAQRIMVTHKICYVVRTRCVLDGAPNKSALYTDEVKRSQKDEPCQQA